MEILKVGWLFFLFNVLVSSLESRFLSLTPSKGT